MTWRFNCRCGYTSKDDWTTEASVREALFIHQMAKKCRGGDGLADDLVEDPSGRVVKLRGNWAPFEPEKPRYRAK